MMRDENPSQCWALLKELSNTDIQKCTSDLPTDDWFTYFKNLNKKRITVNSDNNHVEELYELEKEKIFTEIDNLISKLEIEKCISSLKNWKASGFDSISNEMLKSSQLYLISSIPKVVNTVLSTGTFPKIWAKGCIVHIFKNGSRDDPSNYRGITTGSC